MAKKKTTKKSASKKVSALDAIVAKYGAGSARKLGAADERIAGAGSFYNSRVVQLNRRVESWPSSIVARRHGFDRAEFFDV